MAIMNKWDPLCLTNIFMPSLTYLKVTGCGKFFPVIAKKPQVKKIHLALLVSIHSSPLVLITAFLHFLSVLVNTVYVTWICLI